MKLSNIDYSKIYRVYIEEDSVVIWFADDSRINYSNLSKDNIENICIDIVSKAKEKGYALEVHNGLQEAKNCRFYGAKNN